jgi:hypothetical protein
MPLKGILFAVLGSLFIAGYKEQLKGHANASMGPMKRNLQCLSCQCELHKSEAQFVDEMTFAFYLKLPEGVQEGVYCAQCFDLKISSEIATYNEKLERAKNVNVFFATQSKESRFVRRIEKPVRVENCTDRDETVLRLAFLAVEANKNSIVDVDLKSTKVKNGRWQTSIWSGQGIPADISESALNRRFLDSSR